jgi:hypothetical protein
VTGLLPEIVHLGAARGELGASPDLLRKAIWLRCQQWCRIEAPVGDTVDAACHVKVGDAVEVFHANQEERLDPDLSGSRVEDGGGRVGQVLDSEDRIAWAAVPAASLARSIP